jgi:hypothetical protein
MPLYFCKPTNVVVAVHNDDQITSITVADPVKSYGTGTYLLVDIGGPPPQNSTTTLPDGQVLLGAFLYPTVTAAVQAASTKQECKRRILTHVSEQAQRNITTHINNIQMNRMTQAPARPPTPEEQSDMNNSAAVWAWIGASTRDPTSMLGTCDALVAANDLEFYQDVKWPPWNSAWDAFVAKF